MTKVLITQQQLDDVRALISYVYDKEEKDYRETYDLKADGDKYVDADGERHDPAEERWHIFGSAWRLDSELGPLVTS